MTMNPPLSRGAQNGSSWLDPGIMNSSSSTLKSELYLLPLRLVPAPIYQTTRNPPSANLHMEGLAWSSSGSVFTVKAGVSSLNSESKA